MDAKDVVQRLKKELHLPTFAGRLEEKEYSEAEYQQLKEDLLQYFADYVANVEGYFPGTDMVQEK